MQLSAMANCVVCVVLLLLASAMYTVAIYSNSWFIIEQPNSYYGIWSVTFCDYVKQCQIISALFNDEPWWYRFVQLFSVIGLGLMLMVIISLSFLLQWRNNQAKVMTNWTVNLSNMCVMSALSVGTSLTVFYTNLMNSSPNHQPSISWSPVMAVASCILQCELGTSIFCCSSVLFNVTETLIISSSKGLIGLGGTLLTLLFKTAPLKIC